MPQGEGALNAQRSTLNVEAGRATGGDACPTGRCNWKVLEERLRDLLRLEHYAYATEQSYIAWVKRYVPLPKSDEQPLREWLERQKALYESDKARNMHEVEVPYALARKYPSAPFDWGWVNKGPLGIVSPADTL